jgi:D-alanyl-D-alanine carboxypeptidase
MTSGSRLTIPTAVLLCLHAIDGRAAPSTPDDLLQECRAQAAPPSRTDSIGAIVDGLVSSEIKSQGLPGLTIEVARHGRPIYARAYGYADLTPCLRTQVTTDYQIGSVTKQFTAAAILQLQSTGKLALDDAVAGYLPAYAFDSRITVRMLLNQTSGLPDYLSLPAPPGVLGGAPIAEQTVLTAIAQGSLVFPPGTAYEYSNSNYFLLGAVIEVVSGVSYSEYLDEHIFSPARLHHTSLTQPLHAAAPYSYDRPAQAGATGLAPGIVLDPSVYFSAGALWSDVSDLARWDRALLSGRILPAAQLELMVTPPAGVPVFDDAAAASNYAMGWVRTTFLGHPFVWHNGGTLAYTAFNGVFLDSGWSVSMLTNVHIIQENTPFGPLAQSLIEALCTSKTTDADCFGRDHELAENRDY